MTVQDLLYILIMASKSEIKENLDIKINHVYELEDSLRCQSP